MTRIEFDQKIRRMAPGARIVYHIGNLMRDRVKGPDYPAVHATGMAAWLAYEAGKVDLVQRSAQEQSRLRPGVILATEATEYIAVKLPEPHKKVKWVGCYDYKRKSYNKSVKEVA